MIDKNNFTNQQEEKSNTALKILVFVLIGIIGFLIGFIVSDKLLKTDENNNPTVGEYEEKSPTNDDEKENDNTTDDKENENTITELSINDSLVQELWELSFGKAEYITNSEKITDIYQNNQTIVYQLPDYIRIGWMVDKIYDPNRSTSCNPEMPSECSGTYYTASEVNKAWNKLFGSENPNDLKGKVKDTCTTFINDGSLYIGPCGGDIGPLGSTSSLVKAEKNSDEIVLYESVKFIDYLTDDLEEKVYYSNIEKTQKTTKDDMTANYKRVFKKDSTGNYYFYSIEKVK